MEGNQALQKEIALKHPFSVNGRRLREARQRQVELHGINGLLSVPENFWRTVPGAKKREEKN